MSVVHRGIRPQLLSAALLLCVGLAFAPRALAERQHTVRSGQSLALIAKQYNVNAAVLAAANGLAANQELRGGQVLTVPPEGIVFVTNGQTLSGIAHQHGLGVLELARTNSLDPAATLHLGQRLLLPGYRPSKNEQGAERRWGRTKQRGVVEFYRIWSQETERIRLVDARGRVKLATQNTMREFLRPRESRKRKTPNARLLSLVAQVSDHYGGRTLHVVSGYRPPGGLTRATSRHVAGEALDFRIPGVPLTELRDYCAHFENVGVGYYPRTQFVHLDVRRQAARWTDWSLPGQPAILQKPVELNDESGDGAASPQPKNEAEIPEAPPAIDDGQPPLDTPPEPSAYNAPPAPENTHVTIDPARTAHAAPPPHDSAAVAPTSAPKAAPPSGRTAATPKPSAAVPTPTLAPVRVAPRN
jgi:uncharacterized protein YcbK (DUF882 family)